MTSDSEPLPQAEALKALQNALHDLQAAGVWVAAMNLPVPPGQQPRVALLLEGVWFEGGSLSLMTIEAAS